MKPEKINEQHNIWGDGIAKVEHWDFSRTNMDEQSRIDAITTVASICYDNPNVVGKESLYNRLKAESMGLPSSSFEFVPVLLCADKVNDIEEDFYYHAPGFIHTPHILKYGERVAVGHQEFLLTNLRALLSDLDLLTQAQPNRADRINPNADSSYWFNTEEECEIIRKHHNTFLTKMDIATSKQFNRHRVSLQELSRRYVSGKKTPFEFYGKLDEHTAFIYTEDRQNVTVGELAEFAVNVYHQLLNKGVQPQDARRILPQSMYTTIWSAWLPSQLENFINLRTDKHSQWEIRQIAEAMQNMVNNKK